jgi:hypothetical protein
MKRSAPMKRSGFERKTPERRPERQCTYTPRPRAAAVAATGPARAGVPVPKRVYVRSQELREAYRLLPCQFDTDEGGRCGAMDGTVCCVHSNWQVHGKGGRIKADDNRAASGCARCHAKLDQGGAWDEATKQRRWWQAHVRSVLQLLHLKLWPADVPVPDLMRYPW